MAALKDIQTFRVFSLQGRIRQELVTKHGVPPFEILQWAQDVSAYCQHLIKQESGPRRQTDKGVYHQTIYEDFMRKFKKAKRGHLTEHCTLWATGATQDEKEQATTDFQIKYIMNNVFPGQKPGPAGEVDRLRTCLYYAVRSLAYR